MSAPLPKTLVTIAVDTDGTSISYSKPDFEKDNLNYQLQGDGESLLLLLDRDRLTFPLTLLFSTSGSPDWVVAGLGFAEVPTSGPLPTPQQHTELGSCGGCFTLDEGVGALNVGVVDSGTDAAGGYAFKVWLQNPDTGKGVTHDPRVYNRGKV